MQWNGWDTVLHDDRANLSHYELIRGTGLQAPNVLRVKDDTIYFGTDGTLQIGQARGFFESYLRLNLKRYKDVDITTKVQIESTAKTDGVNEDLSHWFGIAVRALRPGFWDAYLFHIRKDGRVEFGIRGDIDEKPGATAVSSRPVAFRVKVEDDHIQTWVDDKQYHDRRDELKEFIRAGDIYLVSYGSITRVYEVKVRVKKWYAPLLRFIKRFWKIIAIISAIVSLLAGVVALIDLLSR